MIFDLKSGAVALVMLAEKYVLLLLFLYQIFTQ